MTKIGPGIDGNLGPNEELAPWQKILKFHAVNDESWKKKKVERIKVGCRRLYDALECGCFTTVLYQDNDNAIRNMTVDSISHSHTHQPYFSRHVLMKFRSEKAEILLVAAFQSRGITLFYICSKHRCVFHVSAFARFNEADACLYAV